jgi:hypothetical protein
MLSHRISPRTVSMASSGATRRSEDLTTHTTIFQAKFERWSGWALDSTLSLRASCLLGAAMDATPTEQRKPPIQAAPTLFFIIQRIGPKHRPPTTGKPNGPCTYMVGHYESRLARSKSLAEHSQDFALRNENSPTGSYSLKSRQMSKSHERENIVCSCCNQERWCVSFEISNLRSRIVDRNRGESKDAARPPPDYCKSSTCPND